MDADRFDAISRSLSTPPSRRGALRLLAGLVFGGFITLGAGDTDAHDTLPACKKKKGKARKKCLKKAKAHNATHTTAPPPPLPECGTPADCPAPNGPCRIATCSGGRCGVTNRAPGTSCDDGLFCNGRETCDGSGNCQPGTPPACNDGVACTDDTCDEATESCIHTPNHGACGPHSVCDPTRGCVCQPGASCFTGELGRCGPGTIQCISGNPVCIRNQGPIAEICNGIDDDCDGVVDEGAICPGADNAQGACVAGNCTITCEPGFDDCDDDPTNGCETDLMNDDFNCGTCGWQCPCPARFIPTCVDGICGCQPDPSL